MSLERQVIDYYKQVLYKFFEYNEDVNYCVVGGTAIKLQMENQELVQSIDADVHVWSNTIPDSYNDKIIWMEQLKTRMEEFFKKDQSTFGYATFAYYSNLPETKDYQPLALNFVHDRSRDFVMFKIIIFGFDLSDVVYKKHSRDEIFDYSGLPVLKIKPLLAAQIEVFAQNLSENYKPEYAQFKASSNYYPTREDRVKGIGDLIFNSIVAGISADEFLKMYFISPNQYAKSKTPKGGQFNIQAKRRYIDMMSRIPKTYKRIELILKSFTKDDINIFPAFHQGGASCIVMRYRGDGTDQTVYADVGDEEYCVRRTVFGIRNEEKAKSAIRLDKKLIKENVFVEFSISENEKESIDLLFSETRRQTRSSPPYEIYDAIARSYSLKLIDIWSRGASSHITQTLRDYYVHKKFNIPWDWSKKPVEHAFIKNFQKLCMSNRLVDSVEARKTSRNIVFVNGKSTANFNRGDSVFQYIFHSVSINPTISLVMFSAFQVGSCAYLMELPAGFPGIYLGKRGIFAWENQFEFVLPFGCTFVIDEVEDGKYISDSNRNFYQMKVYKITVIPPKDDKVNLDDVKIIEENSALVLEQNNIDDDLYTPLNYAEVLGVVGESIKSFVVDAVNMSVSAIFSIVKQVIKIMGNVITFTASSAKNGIAFMFNFLMEWIFIPIWNYLLNIAKQTLNLISYKLFEGMETLLEKSIKLLLSAKTWSEAKKNQYA